MALPFSSDISCSLEYIHCSHKMIFLSQGDSHNIRYLLYLVLGDLHGGAGLHHDLGPRLLQLGVVVELALEVDPTGGGVKLLK